MIFCDSFPSFLKLETAQEHYLKFQNDIFLQQRTLNKQHWNYISACKEPLTFVHLNNPNFDKFAGKQQLIS